MNDFRFLNFNHIKIGTYWLLELKHKKYDPITGKQYLS